MHVGRGSPSIASYESKLMVSWQTPERMDGLGLKILMSRWKVRPLGYLPSTQVFSHLSLLLG